MIIGKTAAAAGVDVAAAQSFIGRQDNIAFLTDLAGSRLDADLFVKAALVGQILSIGAATSFGAYSQASTAYIMELMNGQLRSEQPVDLIATYGPQQDAGLLS